MSFSILRFTGDKIRFPRQSGLVTSAKAEVLAENSHPPRLVRAK